MQRFEYLVVVTSSGGVVAVNGKPTGSTTTQRASLIDKVLIQAKDLEVFSPERARKIWDYLNERGDEGWELVAIAGGTSGGEYVYTLKRSIT
ncbi:hypothetical protein [Candidatus Promineifilum breve]|uniref:hypothetical protein n=1 Tax=Candidatus Promineifilum breve TaxID=1806508 RepID=UPI0012FFA5D6|nr:hypothetical protein [Candidatus Promineifilum breve]